MSFLLLPMQGESNVLPDNATSGRNDAVLAYACLFPAMITEWRRVFAAPSAFFGFIQLSTWCKPGGAASGIPAMRGQIVGEGGEGQMAALRLPCV